MLGFLMCLSCVRSQGEVRSIDCQKTNKFTLTIDVIYSLMTSR